MKLFDDAPGCAGKRFGGIDAQAESRLARGDACPHLLEPFGSEAFELELAGTALSRLKALGADFGDLRLGRDATRVLVTSDENVGHHEQSTTSGIGIRALFGGFWGFAATPDLTPAGVAKAAERACAMARGVAKATPAELGLPLRKWAEEPPHKATFHTPVGVCPFAAGAEALAAPLLAVAKTALERPGIKRVSGFVQAFGRRRLFASTDGARILTTHVIVDAQARIIAVAEGTSAYRTLVAPAAAGGLEHFFDADFPGQAREAADEALLKCGAAKPAPGRYTLILDPHNLALTMHESVGHPTELDRVLGYELGFAGGSFADLSKLGKFQYGSPLVNFTANNRIRYGGASCGFDDEGVEAQSFPIIREGTLVGYGTSRETAHAIGQRRSNGTTRSTSWYDAPIVRIPNLYLEPGRDLLSLDELIADTKDGILMLGRDSFSIDQMRYNFQFGADMCWRIKDGKKAEPLRDVIYQSISPDFWRSMDAVCDEREWRMHGVFNCGKGQPTQAAKMMHGAAPARFRDVQVGY